MFKDPSSKVSHPSVSLESISPNLFMQVVAGTNTPGNSGDGFAATSAQIAAAIPWVDSAGNIYIPDYGAFKIRKISGGIISSFGGTGNQGSTGTGGAITSVSFYYPWCVMGDTAGTALYISDSLFIWKYIFASGIVSVYAGSTSSGNGFSGDSLQATVAQLSSPNGIWLTTANELFIADYGNHRIRKVLSNGIITTVAGSGSIGPGSGGFSGDGGPALSAVFRYPLGIYVDSTGKIYIADTQNHRIRVVNINNIISTLAGTGSTSFNGDSIPGASANINSPYDVKGNTLGNIYIADYGNVLIRMVDTSGIIATVFGNPGDTGFTNGISSATSSINSAVGLWISSSSGTIYFSDRNSIRRSITVSSPTSQPSGRPSLLPTSQPSRQPTTQPSRQPTSQPSRKPTTQPSAQPSSRPSIQPTRQPSLQPTSHPSKTLAPSTTTVQIPANLFMELVAGTGTAGNTGDGGSATLAQIGTMIPFTDNAGNIWIPDSDSRKIRKIDPTGIISYFGGSGSGSITGTGGPIASVSFNFPYCIVGDTGGTVLYISDQQFVWKYVIGTGINVYAHSTTLGLVSVETAGLQPQHSSPIHSVCG
jgi:hypothetical protein